MNGNSDVLTEGIDIESYFFDTEANTPNGPARVNVIEVYVTEDLVTNLVLETVFPHKTERHSVTIGDIAERVEAGELIPQDAHIDVPTVKEQARQYGKDNPEPSDSARYANIIAPTLRRKSGMIDGGHGEYQIDRQVIADDPKPTGSVWNDRQAVSARDLFGEIHDAFHEGRTEAWDEFEG